MYLSAHSFAWSSTTWLMQIHLISTAWCPRSVGWCSSGIRCRMQCTSATVHTCKLFAITVVQIAVHVCSCDRHAPLSARHSWSAFHMCEHVLRRIWLCILHTCTSAHCNAQVFNPCLAIQRQALCPGASFLCVCVEAHLATARVKSLGACCLPNIAATEAAMTKLTLPRCRDKL